MLRQPAIRSKENPASGRLLLTRHKPHAAALLAWYDRHARVLPWRALPGRRADPYAVWLSEIMLQQTTVAAVKPYYERFLARWPTVMALAAAPLEEVMRAWAGLGYYSRARNLHLCARMIAEAGGAFPGEEAALRRLPGIGAYTAAAIAAIAFDKKATVIDGNVERVVARLFALDAPLPGGKPALRDCAECLTPEQRFGDFAQAMMDLGATICTPRSPACAICPLMALCAARAAGIQEELPVKAKKKARPERYGVSFYVRDKLGCVLLRRRAAGGLLGGMSEMPGSEWLPVCDAATALAQAPVAAAWTRAPGAVRHVFTHFALTLCVFTAMVDTGVEPPPDCRWVPEEALAGEALPSLMRKVAALAQRAMREGQE